MAKNKNNIEDASKKLLEKAKAQAKPVEIIADHEKVDDQLPKSAVERGQLKSIDPTRTIEILSTQKKTKRASTLKPIYTPNVHGIGVPVFTMGGGSEMTNFPSKGTFFPTLVRKIDETHYEFFHYASAPIPKIEELGDEIYLEWDTTIPIFMIGEGHRYWIRTLKSGKVSKMKNDAFMRFLEQTNQVERLDVSWDLFRGKIDWPSLWNQRKDIFDTGDTVPIMLQDYNFLLQWAEEVLTAYSHPKLFRQNNELLIRPAGLRPAGSKEIVGAEIVIRDGTRGQWYPFSERSYKVDFLSGMGRSGKEGFAGVFPFYLHLLSFYFFWLDALGVDNPFVACSRESIEKLSSIRLYCEFDKYNVKMDPASDLSTQAKTLVDLALRKMVAGRPLRDGLLYRYFSAFNPWGQHLTNPTVATQQESAWKLTDLAFFYYFHEILFLSMMKSWLRTPNAVLRYQYSGSKKFKWLHATRNAFMSQLSSRDNVSTTGIPFLFLSIEELARNRDWEWTITQFRKSKRYNTKIDMEHEEISTMISSDPVVISDAHTEPENLEILLKPFVYECNNPALVDQQTLVEDKFDMKIANPVQINPRRLQRSVVFISPNSHFQILKLINSLTILRPNPAFPFIPAPFDHCEDFILTRPLADGLKNLVQLSMQQYKGRLGLFHLEPTDNKPQVVYMVNNSAKSTGPYTGKPAMPVPSGTPVYPSFVGRVLAIPRLYHSVSKPKPVYPKKTPEVNEVYPHDINYVKRGSDELECGD